MNWHRFQTSARIALLRTLLFCVNIVFIISGGILILLGIVLRSHFKDFLEITPEMKTSSPFILICLGLVILLIGFLAFGCTIKGQTTLLYIYSVVILLILIAEILLGVIVLMRRQTYEQTFRTSIKKIMQQYPHTPIKSHVDHLQRALSCCGVDSYTDWFETPYGSAHHQVPPSCCIQLLNHTCIRTNLNKENLANDINQNGCYTTVLSAIKNNYPIFGGIIICIALVPLLGIILSCCLARQLGQYHYEIID